MKAFYFTLHHCTMIMSAVMSKLDGFGNTTGNTIGDTFGDTFSTSFEGTIGEAIGDTIDNNGYSGLIRGDSMEIKALIILAAVIALILLILLLTKGSRRKALLDKKFKEYSLLEAEADSGIRYCTEELVKVKHNKEKIMTLSPSDTKLKGAVRFDDVRMDLEQTRSDLRENKIKLETARKNRGNVKAALGIMTDLCRRMSGTSKRLERYTAELRDANHFDGILISGLEKAYMAEERIRNSDIRCSLSISGITGLPGVSGTMSARDFAGNFRTGSYRIDDIPLLGRHGSLGSPENLGPTNLTVYGLPDRDGLLLRGTEKFTIKSGDGSSVRTDSAELLSGNVYELTIKTGRGSTRMELIVR